MRPGGNRSSRPDVGLLLAFDLRQIQVGTGDDTALNTEIDV
jgi:hypothetical protein